MNFEALDGLIQSILGTYKCPYCSKKVEKKDLNIKNILNNSVELDIFCDKCKNHNFLKTEIVSVDLKQHLNEKQLEEFKNYFSKNNITDEQIVKLSKDLKKENISVSDLFKK